MKTKRLAERVRLAFGRSRTGVTTDEARTAVLVSEDPMTTALGLHYLRIKQPVLEELDRFTERGSRWNDETTAEQAAKDGAPLAAAFREMANELGRVTWPEAVAADVEELTRAIEIVADDLDALEGIDRVLRTRWPEQYGQDVDRATDAVTAVTTQLGVVRIGRE